MTVQEAIKLLIDAPMEAELTVAVDKDTMLRIDNIGIIPEGPFGIYKPRMVYIETGEEV